MEAKPQRCPLRAALPMKKLGVLGALAVQLSYRCATSHDVLGQAFRVQLDEQPTVCIVMLAMPGSGLRRGRGRAMTDTSWAA